MKHFFQTFFALIICFSSLAQTGEVSGTVIDDVTRQPVIGAKIQLTENLRAITDIDGTYLIREVPYGKYTLTATMLSFDTLTYEIEVKSAATTKDIVMGGSQEFEEVKVIGNLVDDGRNTPIAVTRISREKINEELGSRDLPMLLNGTPGVYATQSGGGDGDARINIRGFDQRNVGVLIDGVPVNDMENGWVYWSNWFGLDAITSTVQVQRGLGATRLAMPSIGGTINIVTQGIANRKGLSFKQEYGTGDFLRSTISYNSGLLKNGFGISATASYKQGNGWVYGTNTQGFFGYLKIQKKIDRHLISFSAFAAPQQHGQRSYNQRVQYWDTTAARDLGINFDTNAVFLDQGIRFNQHWGYVTDENGDRVVKNERLNYYNKPQITLKDFWVVNKKLAISNILYASIGRGGGTALSNSSAALYDSTGLIDWDQIIQENKVNSLFGGPNTDPFYHPTALKSSQILVSSVNNHFWLGYLGQFDYKLSDKIKIAGGLDMRYYKGTHYQEINDLLGGDYFINTGNMNDATPMKQEGDKIALKSYSNYRDGLVKWTGIFGQMEYTGARWTYFVNVSGVINGYKGVDHFRKKVLELEDTTLNIGYGDVIEYNGKTYNSTSPGLEYNQTDWKYIPGMTFKTGASFALTEYASVFVNAGYLDRTPQFSNVIDNNYNKFFENILNEKILAFEGGYTFAAKRFGINVNGYFTNWKNKPFPFGKAIPDPNDPNASIFVNIPGMDALHVGGELDIAYKVNKVISTEFMFSYGDWTWQSKETIYVPEYDYSFTFDARGVHVGDAAQTALSAAVRFEPFKNVYFKVQYQYFDRYYANFSPFDLQGENAGRETWKLPAYGLLNFFAGYKYRFKHFELYTNGSIINALNTAYIAEANDNYYAPNNSDAQSASVMFGQGFRFNVSLGIQF